MKRKVSMLCLFIFLGVSFAAPLVPEAGWHQVRSAITSLRGSVAAELAPGTGTTNASSASDPGGKMALTLMGLFALWTIGALVLWEDNSQGSESSVTDALIKLNQRWADAEVAKDTAAIDEILAPEFVLFDEDGARMTRHEVVLAARGQRILAQTLDQQLVNIEDERATVHGFGRMLYETTRGEDSLSYRFETVFAQQQGSWKVVEQHIWRAADAPASRPASSFVQANAGGHLSVAA